MGAERIWNQLAAMSTVFRQSINTSQTHLERFLQETTQIATAETILTEEQYEGPLQKIQLSIKKLSRSLATIETNHQKWTTFLENKFATAEYKQEVDIYTESTNKENSFLVVMEKTKETLCELEIKEKTVFEALKRLRSPAPSYVSENEDENYEESDCGEEPAQRRKRKQPKQTAKLPQFQLKQFSGDIMQWSQFWDSFLNCIDSQQLADIQKLSYLLSYLEGEELETANR